MASNHYPDSKLLSGYPDNTDICFSPTLYAAKIVDKRKTYLAMDSPIHDKHDGVSCNSVLNFVCKLQSFFGKRM